MGDPSNDEVHISRQKSFLEEVLSFKFWVLSFEWLDVRPAVDARSLEGSFWGLEGSCLQLLGVASNAPPGQMQSGRLMDAKPEVA
jgi:hypothetical protein